MKGHRSVLFTGLPILALAAFCFTSSAVAATYTWDSSGLGTQFDGPGVWSVSSPNWWNSGTDIPWTTGADSAVFGTGAAGGNPFTVTLGSNVSVAGVTFANQNYTVAGDAGGLYGLTIGSGGITANAPATISAPIALSAPQQWTNNSSGAMTVTSNIASGGNLLTIGGSGTTTIAARLNGASGLTVGPSSTLVVTTSSGYTGPTTINGGMLTLQAPTLAAAGAPSPLVWFDPSNPAGYTTSGGSVTSLINLSAANSASVGNAVTESGHGDPTLTTANPAFNGMTTLHFNGSQALGGYNLSAMNGTSYTIFSVEAVAANGNYYYLGTNAGATNQGMHVGYQTTGTFYLGQYANDLSATAPQYNGSSEVALEWTEGLNTATGHFINMNGQSLATNTNTTGFNNLGSTDYGIIGAGFSYSNPFLGDVGEVLIYNSTLTAAQSQAVEAYLQAKWEMNGMLPATTPVTLSSGGTLNLNGVSQTIGSLASSDPTTQVLLNGYALSTGSNNTNTTFAGVLSGSGQLIKVGTGAFALTGNNTYTGATSATAGTLQFLGSNSLPAASAINLGSATLQFRSDGAGNNGTINIGNSITLSTGTTTDTINVGNLATGNTGNTVAFGVLNNGVPANNLASTINFTGANGYAQSFSGLGLAGNTGNGTTLNPTTASVVITGNVTNQEVGNSSQDSGHYDTLTLAGSSTGNVIAGVISDASGYGGISDGDTRITVSATSGAWSLNGQNTFHGPINITAGTLTIGGAGYLGGGNYGGTSGSTFTDNGVFVMNTSSNQTFSGVISGAGAFYQLGNNVTVLAGSSDTLSGITTIGGGTLQVGAGNLGSISGPIVNNSVLAFGRTDSVINSSVISGNGALHQLGSGSLALAGSNTYSGGTFVNSGTLYLNGPNSTPSISVAGGATLGGSGSYPSAAATVANNGSVSPGYNGAGSLTLGSLNFGGNGTINVSGLGNYALLPLLNITGSNSLALGGGAGSVTIALGGTAPRNLNTDYRLLKYSGAIGGAGFGGLALNSSGLSGISPLATLSLTTTDAGYVDLVYNSDYLVWTGSGDGVTWSTAVQSPSNWKLASNSTQTNFASNDPVVFDDTAGINSAVSINGGNVAPFNVIFNNNASSYVLTGSNGITGPANVVMNGSGSVTISTSNNYSGGTTVNAGILADGTAQALGTGPLTVSGGTAAIGFAESVSSVSLTSGVLDINHPQALGTGTFSINGGVFDNTSNVPLTLTTNNPQNWNGNVNFGGSNPLNLGTGAVTMNASNTVNLGGSTLTVGGVIAGAGFGLTETGSGTLLLNGANTYSGNTLVSGGTLVVGNASALQNSNLDTSGSGTVSFGPTAVNVAGLINGGSLTLANTASAPVNLTVGNNGGNSSYMGSLLGSGSLTKAGGGTLYLGGSNSFTGATTLSAGTLQYQGNNSMSAASPISLGSATLQVHSDGTGSGGTINVGGNITLSTGTTTDFIDVGNLATGNTGNTIAFGVLSNGTSANALSSTFNFTGANGYVQSYTGFNLPGSTGNGTTLNPTSVSIVIAGPVNNQETSFSGHFDTMTLAGSSTGNLITGPIADSSGYGGVGDGDTRITVSTTGGAWTLTGPNTFHGPINITAGTLTVGGAGYLGGGNYGTASGASFTNNGVFVMNTSSNQTFSGVISGSGAFYQNGSGSSTFNAANTYAGATYINGDTLALGTSGSINSSSTIALSNGATFNVLAKSGTYALLSTQTLTGTGNNSIAGSLTVNSGATVLPGGAASSGTLNVGALTLSTGSVLKYDLGSPGAPVDLINVTNSSGLTVNGGGIDLYQSNGSSQFSTPGTYALMDFSGAFGGVPGNLSVLNPNLAETYVFSTSGNALLVTITTPSSWTGGGSPVFNWSNSANWSSLQAPANGASLTFSGSTGLTNNNDLSGLSLAGMIFSSSAGAFNLSGNSIQLVGAINNLGTTTQIVNMNVGLSGGNQSIDAAAGNIVLNGVVSDGGAGFGLNLTGSAAVVLGAANTYSGPTTVSAGSLNLAHPLAVQNSTVNVSGGALAFAAGVTSPTLGGLSGSGNVALATAASEPVALGVGGNGQSTTYTGILSGAGGLVKQGAGTLTLSASQTYSGPTLISGGVLQLQGGGSIGVHFEASSGAGGAVTGSNGVFPMSNWNNLSGASFTNTVLSNNSGAATSANLTVTATGGQSSSGSSNQLINGYLYVNNYGTMTATLGGIPYSKYNLYTYISDSSTSNEEEVTVNGTTYYYITTGNSPTFSPITSTNSSSFSTGNYVLTTGLTGASQAVSVTGYPNVTQYGSFSGFEIVNTAPTGLPSTTPVTISNGATFDMTNFTQTIASLSSIDGLGSQVLMGSGGLTIAGPAVTTFDGAISGAGGSLALQSGMLTLTGVNTYSGNTTVSAGTLQLGNGASGHDGSLATASLINNGALVYNLFGSQTANYGISGSGSVTLAGGGSITLSASNSYSGSTNILAGTLALGATGSIAQSPAISIGNGATLDVSQVANFHLLSGQTLSGAGNSTVNGAMTANSGSFILPGGATSSGTLNVGALTLGTGSVLKYDLGANQDLINVASNGGLTLNGGGIDLYQADGTTQFSAPGTYTLMDYSGGLGGALSNFSVLNPNLAEIYTLTANGSAILLTITSPNAWNGGGNPSFNWSNAANWSSAQAPTSGNPVTFSGTVGLNNINDIAGLNLAGMIFSTSAGAFNLSGNSIQLSGAVVNLSTATQTIGMNVGLSGTSQTINAAVGNIAVNGVISDGGNGLGINLTGPGAVALGAANTYTGPTNVTAGTLSLAHPLAVQYSTVNVSGGAVGFAAGITAPTMGGLTGTGNVALATVTSQPVALGVGSNAQSTTYSGILSGPGGLVKQGAGTLTLGSSQTYSGPTNITGGVLQLQASGGAGVGIQFLGGGTAISGSAGVFPISNWNVLSGKVFSNVALNNSSGAATSVTLNGTADGTYQTGGTNPLLNGYINDNASEALTMTLTGIPYSSYSIYAFMTDTSAYDEQMTIGGKTYYYSLTTSPTFTQVTNTTSGVYPQGNYVLASGLTGSSQTISVLGDDTNFSSLCGFEIVNTGVSAAGNLPANSPVTISNGSTFDMTNAVQTIASLSSTDGLGSQVFLGGGALTIAGPGVTTFDGSISGGGGSLVVQGGGLTLTGINTYSGNTTVSGGTLQLNSNFGSAIAGNLVVSGGTAQLLQSNQIPALSSVAVSAGLLDIGANSNTVTGVQITGGTIAGTTGVLTSITDYDAQNGTVSAILGGNVNLNKTTGGTVVLAGANTYSGSTSVSAGTLTLAHPLAVQNSTVNLSGGALGFAAGITSPSLGGLTGGGNIPLATAASEAVALNVGANGQSTTYNGVLSGPGGLVKQGVGTLTLTTPQTNSGPTVISGGVLQLQPIVGVGIKFVGGGSPVVSTDGPPGASVSNWNNLTGSNPSGSNLINNSGNATSVSVVTGGGAGTASSGSTDPLLNGYIYAPDGTITVTISGIPYANYSLYAYSEDSTASHTNALTMGGTTYYFTAEKDATFDPITNTNSATYPLGNYAVSSGLNGPSQTVSITSAQYTGLCGFEIVSATPGGGNVLSATSPVIISNGSTLDMTNCFQTIPSLSSTDGLGSQVLMGSGGLTITGPATTTFDGVISDAGMGGSLTVRGGMLTVTGINTYSGPTTLSGGTLQLGDGASGQDGSIANSIVVVDNAALAYNLNGSQIAGYAISGSGSVTKSGPGTLTLNNPSNTYTGGTNVQGGLLVIGAGSYALPYGPLNVSSGSLDLEGNTSVVLNLTGSGTIGNGASGAGSEATLFVEDGGSYSGVIRDGGFGGNAPVGLELDGGTLVLSGTGTFSAGTTVDGGTLVLDSVTALASGSNLIVGNAGAFGDISPAAIRSAGDSGTIAAVPEPGTLALLVFALAVGVVAARRRIAKLPIRE